MRCKRGSHQVSTRDGSKQGKKPLVGIIMGSDTDLPVMSESAKMLEKFGVPYEIEVTSAHRSPARTHEYASTAVSRGLKVVIVAAGGAWRPGRRVAAGPNPSPFAVATGAPGPPGRYYSRISVSKTARGARA